MTEPAQKKDKEYKKAYNYVCRLLTRRDYTVKQIEDKLSAKKYSAETKERVINSFKEIRILNDKSYIEKYVRSRLLTRPRSQFLLKRELYKKGISNADINEYFETLPNEDLSHALELLHRKERSLQRLEPKKRKQRILYLLSSRGFSPDIVFKAIKDSNLLAKD